MPRKANAEAEAEVKTEVAVKEVKKPVAEASEEKETTQKKAARTPTATTETVKVQFGGEEYDFAEIKKAVEADYKAKFKGRVKTVDIYIKPEDKAAYYVINSDFSDRINL